MVCSGVRSEILQFIAVVCALLGVSRAAMADTSAADFIEPVMTHRQYTIISQRLALPYEQRVIAELLFADYTDTIKHIVQQADARADAAGRQRVIDAFSGRIVIDPAELASIRLAMLNIYSDTWADADSALDELLLSLHSILNDEQSPKLAPAIVEVRRQMMLHPRDAARASYEYAGDGVDVLLLVQEAKNGNELHGLSEAALQQVLSTYEHHLDALLAETMQISRDARMAIRIARLQRNDDARREAETAAIEVWQRLYDLNEWTVRQVAAIAGQTLGEEAGAAFIDRFHRACFPWLFTRGVPDRQNEWMAGQALADDQRERVEGIYREYNARRAELLEQARSIMVAARRDLKRVIYPMMDSTELIASPIAQGVFERLLKNSGELSSLEAATSDRFETVLTEQQRLNMRRAIRFGTRR